MNYTSFSNISKFGYDFRLMSFRLFSCLKVLCLEFSKFMKKNLTCDKIFFFKLWCRTLLHLVTLHNKTLSPFKLLQINQILYVYFIYLLLTTRISLITVQDSKGITSYMYTPWYNQIETVFEMSSWTTLIRHQSMKYEIFSIFIMMIRNSTYYVLPVR